MNSVKHEQQSSRPSRSHPDDIKTSHHKDGAKGSELWTDGLLCAYELLSGNKKKSRDRLRSKNQIAPEKIAQDITRIRQSDPNNLSKTNLSRDSKLEETTIVSTDREDPQPSLLNIEETAGNKGMVMPRESQIARKNRNVDTFQECSWVPIGWSRLLELVQMVQVDTEWTSQPIEYIEEEDTRTVADVAAPYWQRPAGPTWWCHVMVGHPKIDSWLKNSQWLHPKISTALRHENQLISERMKHLLYEVPVRVAGGLLFELLGQTVGDPQIEEDDIPIVLRSWQAQNFLVTALHVKGTVPYLNVLGIIEVQDLLLAGGATAPKTAHELIANLASRLARWDDRCFSLFFFKNSEFHLYISR
ncbi:uncharacterized protein LOC131875120 [Cryptomeria japonica]|uniref:uncharacterized protein LOC131875120 n=1 Tax=Cryptomeria japonica TaxID=3369 RepID=UPI0027DA9EFE|nr:uncharacterized protein LOC131875120 [Cryptomeria japonica]